jgi:hypothetical protein
MKGVVEVRGRRVGRRGRLMFEAQLEQIFLILNLYTPYL